MIVFKNDCYSFFKVFLRGGGSETIYIIARNKKKIFNKHPPSSQSVGKMMKIC